MGRKQDPLRNMSMRAAVAYATAHGMDVYIPHRTGEYCFVAPTGERYRCNSRDKDANRKLTGFLRTHCVPDS